MSDALFLHVTDVHLREALTPLPRGSIKAAIPQIEHSTREDAARHLFEFVAAHVRESGLILDGILFSGDAQIGAREGGHNQLLEMLLYAFGPLGITPSRILATPGNHDVPRGSDPGSASRYLAFNDVWQRAGCVVPWFDGIGEPGAADPAKHRLIAADSSWVVYPINSANWCQVYSKLSPELETLYGTLPTRLSKKKKQQELFRDELERLRLQDIARVSPRQLAVLAEIVNSTPLPIKGPQLRIGVLHHHLRSPTLAEEIKAFEGITNLEQLRDAMRAHAFSLVVHGHKHEAGILPDDIYVDAAQPPHNLTVLSGSTFDENKEGDAVRLIHLTGLPHTPNISIQAIPLPRQGLRPHLPAQVHHRLWRIPTAPYAPIVIQSSSIDELYDRLVDLAGSDAKGQMLIAHLDDNSESDKPLPQPSNFHLTIGMDTPQRDQWMEEVVQWWQLNGAWPHDRFPYPHGSRLHHFGGRVEQISRVIALLKVKPTTQALAVLVDPIADFSATGEGDNFASFCLVEFRLREDNGRGTRLDVIGFYRVQEFAQWWPVNIAELRHLQRTVAAELLHCKPGRITTIAGEARLETAAPAQVAIATLDRWHDLYPQRLHALSLMLNGISVTPALRDEVVRGWNNALAEVERIANAKHSGTVAPLPTVGVALLIEYLEASSTSGTVTVLDDLRSLSALNAGYVADPSTAMFAKWSERVLPIIARLREIALAGR